MHNIVKSICCLAIVLCFEAHAPAQSPAKIPYTCTHTYALCIAASCDEYGVCGKCDKSDGSCGYCFVLEGESYSYGTPCEELEPSGNRVFSTYSEALASEYGFKVMTCANPWRTADCMDAPCNRTGEVAPLRGKDGNTRQVPTAICLCNPVAGGWDLTMGGSCESRNCAAIWSTGPEAVLKDLPACSDCDEPDE